MEKSATQSQTGQRTSPVVLLLSALILAALAGGVYYFMKRSAPQPKTEGASAATMHHEIGLKLAREGNMTGATNEWQTAIGLDPGYMPAHLALVRQFELSGDYVGAVKQLDALRRGTPGATHIVCRQAGLYLKANRYETAVATARDAVKSEPDCPQAHTMLGALLGKAGDWTTAVQELQAAHRLAPDQAPITMALAVALGHSGKAEEGIALLEGLPAPERDSPPALYRQGWLLAEYGRNGHKDEAAALETFNRVLAAAPNDPDSNAEAGAILLKQGKTEQARANFDRTLHADPTNLTAARGMATIFTRQNLAEAQRARQIADALEKKETTLRTARGRFLAHPEDTENTLRLAELEERNGNRIDALELITRTLKTDPNNAAALSLLHRLTTTLHK